jgi:hypothetical protein
MMNRFAANLSAGCFAMLILLLQAAPAQNLVFSGTVVGVSPENGTMILANGPSARLTLSGLHSARIRSVDGSLVPIDRLRAGMKVSVAYVAHGQQWVVSRILVPAESQPDVAPVITDPRYRTLFDGDWTTNPGAKAAVDGDITTKPPNSANRDGDITTRGDRP